MIAGGFDYDNGEYMKSVETFDTWTLPDLPVARYGLTLTAVGNLVYSCGGYRRTSACYRINVEDSDPSWSSTTSLPEPMYNHAAAAVSSHIWFSHNSYVHDLDTKTSKFTSYRFPIFVGSHHCAVGNSTHSYIIGIGPSYNEVWLNTIPQNASQWIRVAKLEFGRRDIACLLHDGNIYVTGGYLYTRGYETVEIINTKTHKVWRTGDLITGRLLHAMMVLDGSPAVVSGRTSTNYDLASIEVYNITSSQWQLSTRSLKYKRRNFGLTQL